MGSREQVVREDGMTAGTVRIRRATAFINGLRLFYLDTDSSKPVMLCLHGRWGRAQTWLDLINRFSDRYRIIAPDQRGHGLSDKPDGGYSSESMAEDAYRLLEHLECESAFVVGHSMGGRIAGYLAALHPEIVRAVAILDVSAAGPTSPPDPLSESDGLTGDWPTPFASHREAIEFLSRTFVRNTNVQYFADSLVETIDGFDFMFSRKAMAALEREVCDWFHLLPRLICPVCLVRAGESLFFSADDALRMTGQIENCTYFEVSDSDHMVYADNPGEFYPQFDAFLEKHSL